MRQFSSVFASLFALAALLAVGAAPPHIVPLDTQVPRYKHIFVIMDENKDSWRIDGGKSAPTLSWIAKTFGDATHFYGEVHPSEANYVALLGGSTLGIHDDDAFYCKPGMTSPQCANSADPNYATHATQAQHLGDQLAAAGYTWKGYNQSIPSDGSLMTTGHNPLLDGPGAPNWYASKHTGFINFASTIEDPNRARHIVGFDTLQHDLANNTAPNFALIVPNLCNDMHGMQAGPGVPESCQFDHEDELILRGDKMVRSLYTAITHSALWHENSNSAIVVTFDEDDGMGREGCCGVTPQALSNNGGGHIATMVITNHPRPHLEDPTPYNHYSLLRTIEDAFGIKQYLGIANDTNAGVKPMAALFAVQ
jgi:hypothetical protein